MRLSALADVSKADKKEKMAVDEFFFVGDIDLCGLSSIHCPTYEMFRCCDELKTL